MSNRFLSQSTELLSEKPIIFYGPVLLILFHVKRKILFKISQKQQEPLEYEKRKIGQINSKFSANMILKVQKSKQKMDAFLSFITSRTFVKMLQQ